MVPRRNPRRTGQPPRVDQSNIFALANLENVNMLTELEIYLFDLRGYLVIENALSKDEVAALNAGLDAILPLERGQWDGYVHGHSYSDNDGLNLQQIYEGGEPFERLIDHPSWIEKVKCFVGGEGTFGYNASHI